MGTAVISLVLHGLTHVAEADPYVTSCRRAHDAPAYATQWSRPLHRLPNMIQSPGAHRGQRSDTQDGNREGWGFVCGQLRLVEVSASM